jgi:uncharacterized membrane protein YfcA
VKTLIVLALAGLGAQLVDGSLGMGYGVTSTTLLLALGTNPAAASATVHLAEIGTNLASGISHWRFGNVDWKVVAKIGVPGAIGAYAGATVLSHLSTEVAAPAMSLILLGLGIYLLVRFTLRGIDRRQLGKPMRARFLTPLGLVAGFIDATGGGGWGPVSTPAILASGGMIVLSNVRALLTSDWIDAPTGVRYAVYAVVYLVWAAAVVHSYREYRKDQAQESADAVAAESAAAEAGNGADENHVAPLVDEPDAVRAGRPQAPQD